MKKLSIGAVTTGAGLATIILTAYLLSSLLPGTSSPAEASRLIVQEGNLYRASNVFGSKRFSEEKDIQMLFQEKNGRLLVGKGFQGGAPESELTYSTNLYLMNDDGSNSKKVTDKLVDYAFFDQNGEHAIYLTRELEIHEYDIASGKNELLAKEASIPNLSPDGKKLVYLKAPPGWVPGQYFDGTPGLAILDMTTKKEKLLTKPVGQNASNDYAPQWTPDGKHIIFFNDGLYIVNADGSERTQLTNKDGAYSDSGALVPGISDDPLWSSDGQYFLYQSDHVIWIIELDIAKKRLVSARPIAEGVEPRWAEEGKTISILDNDAKAGAPALTIVDLHGNVVSGDKTKGNKSYHIEKSRITPTPPLPPEVPQEVPSESLSPELRLERERAFSAQPNRQDDVRKEVPPSAVKIIHQ